MANGKVAKKLFQKNNFNKVNLAKPLQKFQDWFTQEWVIISGKRIEPKDVSWLMGPFGKLGSIADDFVKQLADDEGLVIQRNNTTHGLIPSFQDLELPGKSLIRLSEGVKDFYENTAHYSLNLIVRWNPLFKILGKLVNALFSRRIKQLNVPTNRLITSNEVTSEIITLKESNSEEVKYVIWYRTFSSGGNVLYSGIYSTCTLPSGKICVKAVFPLPNGNATVIMSPTIGENGEFILNSSGRRFGDPGFYFSLIDSKGKYWSKYIRSFRDKLTVNSLDDKIFAEQILSLWHLRVLSFNYKIKIKE